MEQLFEELSALWENFQFQHAKFMEKGTKSAAMKARTALGEIKNKVVAYRKASVEETKK
jgi:hypothetical protein